MLLSDSVSPSLNRAVLYLVRHHGAVELRCDNVASEQIDRRGANLAGSRLMATEVNAPMVGKILSLVASVGDQVNEDDTIVIMEAMKMEIEIAAPESGTITAINVAPGDAVDPDTVIAVIE
jgi:biotin carboxyl carrier protein